MEIQLENQFIEKLKLLQEDLFYYLPLVDYFGDEEEYIFTFEGEDKSKWALEKFGSDDGVFEFKHFEIEEMLSQAIEKKNCSSYDKIFFDHLVSYLD